MAGKTGLFLEVSASADAWGSRTSPWWGKGQEPCPPPHQHPPVCSHICTWPAGWTFQTHAPNSGFGWRSPWMVLTCSGLCSCLPQWMMGVGCMHISSGLGYHLDSVIYSFYTCFTSPGPSCVVQSSGDSREFGWAPSASLSTSFLLLWQLLLGSWAITWAAPSTCCHLPSFTVSFSWGSLFYLLQDCDTTWSIHYKGCERMALRDSSMWWF